MLPGCGSAPPAPPGAFLLNTAGGLPSAGVLPLHHRPSPGRSWMSPDAAKTKDLLYVSNLNSGTVNVYSYPDDKQVGTIKGNYDGPDGICVDKKNDIWVVNNSDASLVEYKHGGTTPIATLTGILLPIGRSVIRRPGTLPSRITALALMEGEPFPSLRMPKALQRSTRIPKYRTSIFAATTLRATFTPTERPPTKRDFLAELPKGGKTLKSMTLTGGTI